MSRVFSRVGLCLFTAIAATGQEFRAAWADVFHVGMGSQAEVNTMVSALVAARYNAVIVQVVGYMDRNGSLSHGAHWKSNILPWSPRVTDSFDPLAYLCQQAHANGIEVHAWLGGSGGAMYRVSTSWPPANNAVLSAHPEWFIVPLADSEANTVATVDGNYILDMGSPDAQEYVVSIVKELVTNYPIDGINWDDEINGGGYNVGFNYPGYSQAIYPRSGLARFRINTGFSGTPSNTNVEWSDYRRRFKNELMARVQAEIQSIKTNPRQPLRHTTAALAYSPVPTSCNFVDGPGNTVTPYRYFCDWAAMLQNGWVDAVIPQTYSISTYSNWAYLSANCWQQNRNVFPGLGAYLNANSSIVGMIATIRDKGLKGFATYSYAVPNNSGTPGDWWAFAAANITTNSVSIPPMPWRNPVTATEGIVWGRVKDYLTDEPVDDAIVTVAGRPPVRTDGNGYYVATMVPCTAGGTARLVTASKTGMTPQSTNAIALAGDVARYDLFLNAPLVGLPAAPSGLAATPLSESQIALSWTDNATNETAILVGRSITPGGPYVDVAALSSNIVAFTNSGLAANTTYYYVVRATNSIGASLYSAEASATTFAGPPSPPDFTKHPTNHTIFAGESAHFVALATGVPPPTYQWQFNGTNIPGATRSSFTLSGVTLNQAGGYAVVATNSSGALTSDVATLTINTPITVGSWKTNWSLAPYSRPYLTTNSLPFERSLAHNPVTKRLLVASRNGPHVNVLAAATGADLHELNVSTISGGTYPLLMIGVADDGVVYGGNLTLNGATDNFKLYRWANDEAATVPTVAFSGDPGAGNGQRWGDTLDVRGAGTNTQIIIASRATNIVSVLTTADGTNFTATRITVADAVPGGPFGLGVAFGAGNTFWGKATSQNLRQVSFNLANGTGSTIRNHGSPDIPNTLAPLGVHRALNILGIINVGATGNTFRIYDLASPTPSLIAVTSFASDYENSSSGTGAVDFDYDRAFALGANNGIIAMQLLPAATPPTIVSHPEDRSLKVGTNVTFTASATGTEPLSYQWQFNSMNIAGATSNSFTIASVNWTNEGQYTLVVTNIAGATNSLPATLTVLAPDPSHIDSIALLPDGRVEISASGDVGNYSIEISTNLLNWDELFVVPNTNGTFLWMDQATNAPQRFFRARYGP